MQPFDARRLLLGQIGRGLAIIVGTMAFEHLLCLRFELCRLSFELGPGAAFSLAGVARQLHAVDGEHLAADQTLHIADERDRRERVGDFVAETANETCNRGEVRSRIPGQGDEGDVFSTGAFDRSAADDAAAVGKQDQLEQDSGRVSGSAGVVVAVAGIETG